MRIVIFSSIPWEFLWQRPQQIALRLANKGHSIVYLQSLYLLAPSIFIEIYKKNIPRLEKITKNLSVVNLLIPPFLGKLGFITQQFCLLNLKACLRSLNFKPDVAIFYFKPNTAFFSTLIYVFLLDRLKSMGVKVLYDCVDEHSAFPDAPDVSAALKAEEYLAANSSIVTVTSKTLFERISKFNSNCFYVPNASDYEHFLKARQIKAEPHEIRHLQRPIIGFVGAVNHWVNTDLLCRLADLHSDYSILIVGPVLHNSDKLQKYSNIKLVGPKRYGLLPQYLSAMDVCIIPFKINRLTLASNPIKLYEYLATGKPVVSSALPEVCNNVSQIVYVAKNDDDFIRKVEEAVGEHERPESKALISTRIEFARDNSWEKRVAKIEELLETCAA